MVVICGVCVIIIVDVCFIFGGDVVVKLLNCIGMFLGLIVCILFAICFIIVVIGSCDVFWFLLGKIGVVFCL